MIDITDADREFASDICSELGVDGHISPSDIYESVAKFRIAAARAEREKLLRIFDDQAKRRRSVGYELRGDDREKQFAVAREMDSFVIWVSRITTNSEATG